MLNNIILTNFLSFQDVNIELRNLNILIGVNGSGKSNLIDAIELLHSAPEDIAQPIREGGGVTEWIWKGTAEVPPSAKMEACFSLEAPAWHGGKDLRHVLSFASRQKRFEILDERIENANPDEGYQIPYFYYKFQNGRPTLNIKEGSRELRTEEVDLTQSILAQRKDPDTYPEITYLGKMFADIRIYRDWYFGRHSVARLPERTDEQNVFLEKDFRNWNMILNRLSNAYKTKQRILDALRDLRQGITDYHSFVAENTVQLLLQENGYSIPATRLSDGTLHFLCLLAILCDPAPPPLVCIEEPELGLHPDILPTLSELLREAASRTQLIVTTHSATLVDLFSDEPDAVIVAENQQGASTLARLSREELAPWLEDYRLGQLWMSGEIGGTRW